MVPADAETQLFVGVGCHLILHPPPEVAISACRALEPNAFENGTPGFVYLDKVWHTVRQRGIGCLEKGCAPSNENHCLIGRSAPLVVKNASSVPPQHAP